MAEASIGGRKGPRYQRQEANLKIASRRAQFRWEKKKPTCSQIQTCPTVSSTLLHGNYGPGGPCSFLV
jgi:hypothetical protein